MSHCEPIAQVPHDKRATVSESLRSLMIKEQMRESLRSLMIKEPMRESLVFLANSSFTLSLTKNKQFAQKIIIKLYFYVRFLKFFFFKV